MYFTFGLEESAHRGEFEVNGLTPDTIADMKRTFPAYKEGQDEFRQPITNIAPFMYKVFAFADRHGLTPAQKVYIEDVQYETPEDILAFHMCLKALWDDSEIEMLDLDRNGKKTFRVRARMFQATVMIIQQYLYQGHRFWLPDGPSNVRFVNSCLVCNGSEMIQSKCSKCNKAIHAHCWEQSGHENKC